MNAPERFELRQSRFIRAPREKVYDAFVSEAAMRLWAGPRGMSAPQVSIDARVGGRWQMVMQSREGGRFVVGGTYRELRRPSRLVYTWQWESGGPMPGVETVIEVDFVERDGGTELRLLHSGFPAAGMRDAHDHGWKSTFNKLVDLLDARGSAATLTLLGDARSTYTRTVRMALAEKGLAYTFQVCAPNSPEILAVHPFGRIPALRDGDIDLFETSAILRYLDESFGEPTLIPGTIIGRTRCEQWVSAINAYFYDAMIRRYVLQFVFPRGEGGQPDRAVIASALKDMPVQIAALEGAYGSGDYLAGPTLSMADLFIAPILAYVEQMPDGPSLLADAPNVKRAQKVIHARQSFVATEPATQPPHG